MADLNALLTSLENYSRRIIRVATVLVDLHMDIAIQEADYERRRLIGGMVMLSIGLGLFAMAAVLMEVLAILVAHVLGLSWIWATTMVATFNVLVGAVFAAAARARLQGPVMAKTQARLARSAAMLRTGAPLSSDLSNPR